MYRPNKIPLVSTIRELEIDFKTSSKQFNDSLRFAISSLMSGEFSTAKNQFNKCIEQDSDNPAGWLGRAYVEVMDIEPNEINNSNPDEFVLRAKELNGEGVVDKYLDILTAIVAYQQAAAIKILTDYTLQLQTEQAEAFFSAIAGTALGLAGAVVGHTSNSLIGKIAGYSMLGTGAGIAIKQGLDTATFGRIKDSTFAESIAQTYLSIPIISYCNQIYQDTEDLDFKANLKTILDSWKHSVIELYKLLREEFINFHLLLESQENQARLLSEFLDMTGFDESTSFNFLTKSSELATYTNNYENELNEIRVQYPKSDRSFWGIVVRRILLFSFVGAVLERPLDALMYYLFGDSWLGTVMVVILGLVLFYYIFVPAYKSDEGREKAEMLRHDFLTLVRRKTQIKADELEFRHLGI